MNKLYTSIDIDMEFPNPYPYLFACIYNIIIIVGKKVVRKYTAP